VRAQIELVIDGLAAWHWRSSSRRAKAGDAVMPSYTHLQRAEPVLAAHWLLAYVEWRCAMHRVWPIAPGD